MNYRDRLRKTKRVVVKVGSQSLLGSSSGINEKAVKKLVTQCAALLGDGIEVVLVSSGAIACGLHELGRKTRPKNLPDLQMAAAIGQSQLMAKYSDMFSTEGICVGQVLLTHEDLRNRKRHLNARNTLMRLLHHKVIPIINENDVVSTEEIKFGDNDQLAALVSILVDADLLIILTTVPGLYRPLEDGTKEHVQFLAYVDEDILSWAKGKGSEFSLGGMHSKLTAARKVLDAGGFVVIASSEEKNVLQRIIAGEDIGTLIGKFSEGHSGSNSLHLGRKRWIAFYHKSLGTVIIDDGAEKVIRESGKSLLPSGIVNVIGQFEAGSLVDVKNKLGEIVAKGLVEYSSEQIEKIKGHNTTDILDILGSKDYDEVIHRDNMVIL